MTLDPDRHALNRASLRDHDLDAVNVAFPPMCCCSPGIGL